jgi:aspartyl-tRNA(Asn)/glutamyl-tRNA(Gln) amidotransferase subunit A
MAMASSLDQVGIFAHNPNDVALLLHTMAGFDSHDATSSHIAVPEYTKQLHEDKPVRIGVPKEFREGLTGEAALWFDAALERCRAIKNVTLVDISLPHIEHALAVYYIIMPSEVSANMARYDGLRYGMHSEAVGNLEMQYRKNRSAGFGPEVKRRILLGTYALSAGYYDAYYAKAAKVRRLISQDMDKAFEMVDAILGPTSPTPAFKIGEKQSDPLTMYLSDIYTVAANLTGVPAVSFPAGDIKGLPMGLQLMGPRWSEGVLLQLVERFSSDAS